MHFHLVDPGRQFKLYRYDSSYVIWENPNAEELKKEKKIVVDNLSIDYGKSETVEFYNYGRTYLHRTVEVPPFLPDTLCEKFELTYDIINGKYTVDYSFSPHPQDPNAPGREFYHSREAADSILHIWGAQPLNEW
jgi:hypothetical protein